ncbi:DeoR/GlpR family DNA-binding transcription regulator [Lentisphaera profundi]|uniref:DeoR/GlpR family DNA-binding transcription regulator n=1 Tax=Lentisphaera profundi TaxID=1658616 RepID=A0ABY7VX30_9BACT|nr:DeoR/GlpR family DNA-binding transcription regulator [Lentisphaera profundi]WDE97284.1 DeoR/GlpR family DNA-binding transcription regulator [Lentisphaera profundi]
MSVQSKARHQQMMSFLHEVGEAKVNELSQKFNVTEETIRRDLARLEKDGLLIRKHGGAVPQDVITNELSFDQRKIQNIKEKTAIAELALKHIEAGDSIFLDGSTTTWQMARKMPDIPLTIISDSIRVLVSLANHKNITLVSIGGVLCPATQTMLGPNAISSINNYYVDKYFFSCQGLDSEWGVSDNNYDVAAVKIAMLAQSKKHFLLLDNQKVHKRSLVLFASLKEVDHIITDSNTAQNFIPSSENIQVSIAKI